MSGGGKLSPRPLEEYHERTRRRGVNALVYWPARVVIKNAVLLYFRVRRLGREHIPEGGVILAANHRSFLDPFVIGGCLGRPVYFVAKQELFSNRLVAWFLNCMGAFPLRRGESDRESMATALALLERGEAVVIFPEGTRISNGSLGRPKRGVGRLALQSGKPVVPIAVTGSERAREGWRINPVKVHVRCGPPLTFPRVDDPSHFLAGEVTERIWPCVQLQWEWLGGLPPLRTAAVLGAGSTGKALARVLARANLEVQLEVKTVPEIELAGVDLVVLAVPGAALPALLGEVGERIGDRSAVLVASSGLVPPLGSTPEGYVAERVRARAVASLGESGSTGIEPGAPAAIATADAHLRRQLRDVLEAGGLDVEASDRRRGSERSAPAARRHASHAA